ncbi:putative ribonuclease H-like domain-containing protein [Tanacetum coccineum]
MVAQGYTQEERIDYDEVFAHVARIEAIRLFLVYASFMGFIVYQMDVKSAFLYVTIKEEVYVCQPPGFEDLQFPDKVYKVEKALYGLHQAPRAWYETLPTYLIKNGFRRGTIDKTLFIKKGKGDILFDAQEILDESKLGLWYPRDSPFDLEAFSDSDYVGASLDRKSTTGGCQFLGKRLISWQCKTQTLVANSTTEAEYGAAANCCRHVLWIQNQMLDYGFNFMNTKIYIDNESTIFIVKNPVFHSKTKHIKIRHHFIRDCYEKKLIQNTATSKTVSSVKQIHAIVDGKAVVISESSVTIDLLFNDEDGIACLTNDEIFENLALMGYEQLSIKLTFQKGSFSPQWKFLIHIILHCISSKSTAWNEFSTNLASAVICLAKGGDSVERAITTDASLVAAQDSDNILKTQSTAMSNDPLSQEIGSSDRPKHQDTTLGVQMLRLGLRLHLKRLMTHLS